MPDPARATRAAVDRIPRGERGGGRQEGIRWVGKGNHSPPLSGVGPLLAKARRQLKVRDRGSTTPLRQCNHAMNILLNTYQVPSTRGFREKSTIAHALE